MCRENSCFDVGHSCMKEDLFPKKVSLFRLIIFTMTENGKRK